MPAAVAPLPTTSPSRMPTERPAAANSTAQAAPTIPAPMISTSNDSGATDSLAEGIVLVEQQVALQSNERRPGDRRPHLCALKRVTRLEAAADYTLLHPAGAGGQ